MFAMRCSIKSSTSSSSSSSAVHPSGFRYLDSASTTTFFLPRTCLISKSHIRIAPSHQFTTAPGTSADDRLSYAISVWASVSMIKCWPYSQEQNSKSAHTTTLHSSFVEYHLPSAADHIVLANRQGWRHPSSPIYSRTAPPPSADASTPTNRVPPVL
jgi:hypothetical protein